MANLSKFSEKGLNKGARVDVDALSDIAQRYVDMRRVIIATAAGQKQTAVFTQNTTVKHNLGPVGIAGTLKAAIISCETLPAGGTLSLWLGAYDASANGEIVLTDALNPEGFTVREGASFVIATTNVALAADDTIELHCSASNDAVGTDAQGVSVTLVWEPTEDTTLTE